uniref:NADH dehydrogenase [ubiquinone] iron-sulfur protein 4, mitochondrial n=1 Tax=Clastoptera arizonana TaxID=38151 RepID=A0A1B6DRI6_9HEMI
MAFRRLFLQNYKCFRLSKLYNYKDIRYFGNKPNNFNNLYPHLEESRKKFIPEYEMSSNKREYYNEEENSEEITNEDENEQIMDNAADYIKKKNVRIYRRCKDLETQLGTRKSYLWEIDFDSDDRDDQIEQRPLQFPSYQAAIDFISKQGWEYSMDIHQIHPFQENDHIWSNEPPKQIDE